MRIMLCGAGDISFIWPIFEKVAMEFVRSLRNS